MVLDKNNTEVDRARHNTTQLYTGTEQGTTNNKYLSRLLLHKLYGTKLCVVTPFLFQRNAVGNGQAWASKKQHEMIK